MAEFSPTTQKLLQSAGWFPGRRVDIARYEQVLLDNTGPLPDRVREFLCQFGGLHVQTLKKERDLQLDPILASRNFYIDTEGLSEYSERVGSPLYCVGVASRAHMMLLMDQAGRVFAVRDDLIYLAGDSPHNALELLCSGQPMLEFGRGAAPP